MAEKTDYLHITGSVKAPLSEAIQAAYNILIDLIVQVPLQYRTIKTIKGTGGKVSVADIVAYQIGWGKLLVGWYETGLKGEVPDMPGEGFLKWDYTGLARHFYIKYQYDSSDEQAKEFCGVVSKIVAIVEKEYQRGNLDRGGAWDWCTLESGKQWPLSKWVTVNTSSPYKKAAGLVKKFIKASGTLRAQKSLKNRTA